MWLKTSPRMENVSKKFGTELEVWHSGRSTTLVTDLCTASPYGNIRRLCNKTMISAACEELKGKRVISVPLGLGNMAKSIITIFFFFLI